MTQHVKEGAIVVIQNYTFIASDLREETNEWGKRVSFHAELTADEHNDDIRNTGYNNTRYAGNHLVYTWEI